MQETITQFMRPAFKRTNSVLTLVADFLDKYQFLTNWETIEFQGWYLPCTAEPHYWCGEWKRLVCDNVQEHIRLGKGNRVYLKQFQQSCYRSVCKVCYFRWIVRQANNATRRIEQYSHKFRKPIHLILCIPPSQHELPVKLLRQRMSHILNQHRPCAWPSNQLLERPDTS